MAVDEPLIEAIRSVAAALDSLAAPSMIIGGIAVIAAGVPRQTIDVDATVLGREAPLEDVVAALAQQGISPRISNALEFARERQVLLLMHDATGVKIEVSFAWLPFEEEALALASSCPGMLGLVLRARTEGRKCGDGTVAAADNRRLAVRFRRWEPKVETPRPREAAKGCKKGVPIRPTRGARSRAG